MRRPGLRGSSPSSPTVSRVTRGSFRSTVVLTGSLAALRSEEFKVPVTDTWRLQIKWMVKEGDSVKPGDPVVRFDTADLASSIETARESLRAKLEEKAQKEAEYENETFELDIEVKKAENDNRQKVLDASVPAELESRYEHDRKQLEKRKSDHALAAARTNRAVKTAELESQLQTLTIEAEELEAKLNKLRNNLQELTLVAQSEGAVICDVDDWTGRKVQVGDTVYATRVVATVPDLTSLQVRAWVSETQIQQLQAGQRVDLFLDAYPDTPYRGTIRGISKSAEAIRRWGRSHYFQVDIEMDRLNLEVMKPGMSVRCEVQGREYRDMLLVPLEAVAFDGRSFWVRRAGEKAVKLTALENDSFVVAVRPGDNPGLKEGTVLWPPGPVPRTAEETKTGDKL
jgi:multidrug efflux pump subunit AcrA (membrane-fusion protein)